MRSDYLAIKNDKIRILQAYAGSASGLKLLLYAIGAWAGRSPYRNVLRNLWRGKVCDVDVLWKEVLVDSGLTLDLDPRNH